MNSLALLVALPLLGAAATFALTNQRSAQRVVSLAVHVATLALAIGALVVVDSDGTQTTSIGGWPAPISVVYVADRFAALMLVIGLALLTVVLVYAIGQGAADERSPFYHPAYLALTAGVCNAFLAGDLFNLFVAFEILLMASYVLMTLEGNDSQIRSGTTYVVLNIVESMLLLTAVGLVFAATGTVNMAELPDRLAELDAPLRAGLNLLLLLAFGLKAAVFPLFFWLPDSYPTAPSPVSAVFAGLLTKIGVYAIIRTETLLFPGGQRTLIFVIACLTMLIGVLGAIAQSDMKRILSFHIVSQIGYMLLGLGIGGTAGLAATVFYILHHIPVKTSLFLVEGIVEHETGTSTIERVGGMLHRSGPLAVLFLVPAFSLAGIPPLSGFVAKLGVTSAGFDGGDYLVIGLGLLASLLTLLSMSKIWGGMFWGEVTPEVSPERIGVLRHHRVMTGATVAVVAGTLAIAVFAGPIYEFCERAAAELVDPSSYARAVLG
jgi:multicomponent Na+:H+ antiporter subunit D